MTIDSSKGIAGLKGALRYVRAYRDRVFVVKLGGDVVSDPEVLDHVSAQLALLASLTGGAAMHLVHAWLPPSAMSILASVTAFVVVYLVGARLILREEYGYVLRAITRRNVA